MIDVTIDRWSQESRVVVNSLGNDLATYCMSGYFVWIVLNIETSTYKM